MAAKKAARARAGGRDVPLATRAIERLLCNPQAFGDIDRAYPRFADAWSIELPDLTSLPAPKGRKRRTRFCIATEDIVGPVRNGGIGTTFAALAAMLAAQGHDITIVYLKGEEVENETIGYWIDHYAAQGVKFVPVPNYAQAEDIVTNADQWMRPVYNMYRWLLDNPMDVVHVSEWRGSAFMCLTAKRQGIAFQNTLFIVKTSSPWLWNRMYGSFAIDRLGDLAKTLAERRSVELADMAIGGSLHLMRWMASQGYVLPRGRSFVQPNVVSFAHLADLIARRSLKPGRRIPIDEIVFFGRLEARKGLLTFCHAVHRLMKLGHVLPPRITFMGKPGARLAVRPHQTVVDYIEEETVDWPTQVSVLTDYQQHDAIAYLLDGARLAVMPSTIENSSLAVYEAAICHIPFIASDAGGTPELLRKRDRRHVLCDAHPIPLAQKLAEAIDKGGYVAAASFDNERNLEVWAGFNDALTRGLREVLIRRANPKAARRAPPASVDVALFSRGERQLLEHTLDSLVAQKKRPGHVLIAVDADDETTASEAAREAARARGLKVEVLAALDYDAGYGLNEAARHARADYIVFLEAGATLEPDALDTLAQVARRRGADVLTWHHRRIGAGEAGNGQLVTEMIGGPAETLFLEHPQDLPLFVRRSAFEALKGFEADYRVPLHERELVSKAMVSGLTCETVPAMLGTVPERDPVLMEHDCYDRQAGEFRILRPYLAALPLAMREAVLATVGLQRRLQKRPKRPAASNAGRSQSPPATHTPATTPVATAPSQRINGRTRAAPPGPRDGADEPRTVAPYLAKLQLAMRKIVPGATGPGKAKTESEGPAVHDNASISRPARALPDGPSPAIYGETAEAPISLKAASNDTRNVLIALTGEMAAGRNWQLVSMKQGAGRVSAPHVWHADRKVEAIVDDPSQTGSLPRHLRLFSGWSGPEPRDGERYAGRVLDIVHGAVIGWIADLKALETPVTVEVRVDGRCVARVPAGLDLPSVYQMSDLASLHGFRVPLFKRIVARVLKPARPARVDVVTSDGAVLARGLQAWRPGQTLRGTGFQGYLDAVSDATVRGWVWRPQEPERRFDVSIYLDGRFYTRTRADIFRADLADHGIGKGDYAFSLRIPQRFRDSDMHQVDVLIAETGLHLQGSPLTINRQGASRLAAG